MVDLTAKQRAALEVANQAYAAPTTTEDRLVEFAARVVALYVLNETAKGEEARLAALSAVRGSATLCGLTIATSTRVGDRAADHINETMAAVQAVGTGDVASMLLLLKQAKEGGK